MEAVGALDRGRRRRSSDHHPRGAAMNHSPIRPARHRAIPLVLASLALCLGGVAAQASVDADAALSLAKTSGCTKCHAVDRKKDGPAYRDVAATYKGDAAAPNRLVHHITSGEKVKFDDGHEEDHKKVKSKDPTEINNLIAWILSLEGGKKYTPNTSH
jgi:cytochrome c